MERVPGTGKFQRGMLLIRNALNLAFLTMCLALGYGYYREELEYLGQLVVSFLERVVTS